MRKTRKTLATLLVLGAVATVAGFGTFSAFSSTTSNSGNTYAAGTVYVSDDDSGSAMWTVTNQKPGQTQTKCIDISYTGSLPADVSLYSTTGSLNALAGYVDLTVYKGTNAGGFNNCGGFTAQGGAIYTGTLAGFVGSKTTYASGVSVYPGAQTQWNQNDSVAYEFVLSLQDNNSANAGSGAALTTGAMQFTWEARNQ